MIAVVLCAGYATRMYPLTRQFPKPLLKVAGRPVLDYLAQQLLELPEIREIHIVTNNRFFRHFDLWRQQWLLPMEQAGVACLLHNDGSTTAANRLGACRDLKLVLDRVPRAGRMLVSAGDNIYQFPLKALWELFLARSEHHILALRENDVTTLQQTGVPVLGPDDQVLRLVEKPSVPPSRWCCPPLYFLMPSARKVLDDHIQASNKLDAPGHFIARLCRKERVYAMRVKATRLDIGDLDTYRRADLLVREA